MVVSLVEPSSRLALESHEWVRKPHQGLSHRSVYACLYIRMGVQVEKRRRPQGWFLRYHCPLGAFLRNSLSLPWSTRTAREPMVSISLALRL